MDIGAEPTLIYTTITIVLLSRSRFQHRTHQVLLVDIHTSQRLMMDDIHFIIEIVLRIRPMEHIFMFITQHKELLLNQIQKLIPLHLQVPLHM